MYSNDIICNVLDYIEININTKISIKNIEYKYSYNRYYLMRLFKKEIGITILNYINKLRIYNSLKELNTTNNSILKVGLNNGFYSLEYFSEIFKKEIGISPREYKKIVINRYYYNDKIMFKVNNNIINITELINRVSKYKNNKKPKTIYKRELSIFK